MNTTMSNHCPAFLVFGQVHLHYETPTIWGAEVTKKPKIVLSAIKCNFTGRFCSSLGSVQSWFISTAQFSSESISNVLFVLKTKYRQIWATDITWLLLISVIFCKIDLMSQLHVPWATTEASSDEGFIFKTTAMAFCRLIPVCGAIVGETNWALRN